MKRFLHFINYFVVIILVCLHPIITNSQAQSEVKIGTQIWITKNLDVSITSCLASATYSVHVVNQEKKYIQTFTFINN